MTTDHAKLRSLCEAATPDLRPRRNLSKADLDFYNAAREAVLALLDEVERKGDAFECVGCGAQFTVIRSCNPDSPAGRAGYKGRARCCPVCSCTSIS